MAAPFLDTMAHDASRCFFTHGTMGHVNADQPPSRGKPWTTLAAQDFVCKVDLIAPQECRDALQEALAVARPAPAFCRVTMPLGQILQGPFFTEYIKIGNIAMLSEGTTTVDDVFTLREGKLTMYLERETYERAGLVGKPQGVKGKRGSRPRWVVEYDLRSPSMFKGKRGFDRLLHACETALHTPVPWLFCNVSDKTPNPDPLDAFAPSRTSALPQITADINVAMPAFDPANCPDLGSDRTAFEEFATDVYEWLSLVRLQSPRILSDDIIDPYLSRYVASPQLAPTSGARVCKFTWEGFLPPSWTRMALVDAIRSVPTRSWFALCATPCARDIFGESGDSTILRLPRCPAEYMLWDVRREQS